MMGDLIVANMHVYMFKIIAFFTREQRKFKREIWKSDMLHSVYLRKVLGFGLRTGFSRSKLEFFSLT